MKTPLPKLIKKLDALWSLRVRERDNKCILCGGYVNDIKHLQAHHWIVTRNQSSKYRWDLRNGVSLCYGCHIHQVHSNPSVELINRLKELCILRMLLLNNDNITNYTKINYSKLRNHLLSNKNDFSSMESLMKGLDMYKDMIVDIGKPDYE